MNLAGSIELKYPQYLIANIQRGNPMKPLINSLLVLAFLMPVSALADTVRCESKTTP